MQLTNLDLWFWALTLLGHLTLLYIIAVRRYGTKLPVFTGLIIMEVLRSASLFLILRLGTKALYRDAYWLLAILDVCLELAVTFELAFSIFRPLGTYAQDIKNPTILLGSISVVFAVGLTYLGAPATSSWREWIALKGSFFGAALMSELFVCMIALSTKVGLPSRAHVAAIVVGFGSYSILDLLIETAHDLFGSDYSSGLDQMLSRVRIGCYLLCLAFWNFTLWRTPERRGPLSGFKQVQLLRLQRQSTADVVLFRRWRK